MRVKLDEKNTLVSDAYSYWVVEESTIRSGKNEGKTIDKRVSGYLPDFNDVVMSYMEQALRSSKAESLTELRDDFNKLKKEIRSWKTKLERK